MWSKLKLLSFILFNGPNDKNYNPYHSRPLKENTHSRKENTHSSRRLGTLPGPPTRTFRIRTEAVMKPTDKKTKLSNEDSI
jgi:hypothetical protein